MRQLVLEEVTKESLNQMVFHPPSQARWLMLSSTKSKSAPGLLSGTRSGLVQLRHRKCEDCWYKPSHRHRLTLSRASVFRREVESARRRVWCSVTISHYQPPSQRAKVLAPVGEMMDVICFPFRIRIGPGEPNLSMNQGHWYQPSPLTHLFILGDSVSCLLTSNHKFSSGLFL